MNFIPGHLCNIYNRGIQQIQILFSKENYLFFLKKMRKTISPFCEFLSYCLMPDHFHWLVRARTELEMLRIREKFRPISQNYPKNFSNLNNAIGVLLRSYTRAIQKQERFTGSLFQQKTKSVEIFSFDNSVISTYHNLYHDSFNTCFNYIHQNPWKAGLVKRLEEWEFSSFRDYAGLRNGTLCNLKKGLALSGIRSPEEFLKTSYEILDKERIYRIL